MDQTHIHLIANHLPVIGGFTGLLVLIYGLFNQSEHTMKAAYYIFIMSAIGAAITYFTGEAAEHTVENIAGISEQLVENHEDLGKTAMIANMVLGVFAIIVLFLSFRKSSVSKTFNYLLIAVAGIAFGMTAYTAYQGGKIRHSEVHDVSKSTTVDQPIPGDHDEDEDDD